MDYGKLAYLKCGDLEAALAGMRGRESFFRATRTESGEVCGTDPLIVRGRGEAEVRFFAPGGKFVGLKAGGLSLAQPGGSCLRLRVAGSAGGVAVQAFASGARELLTFAEGERPAGGDGNGRGVTFSSPDGLCADGDTLWIARGGRIAGFCAENGELVQVSSCEQFGTFAVSGGVFYWLCAEGLYRSETAGERGVLFAEGACAFAASGGRVCWLRGGKLYDRDAGGTTTVRALPGAEALRFSGSELLFERGGSSWKAADGTRYCIGTGACGSGGSVFASRGGIVYRDGEAAALGEEAVCFDGGVFVRAGSDCYRLEEML